MGNKNLIVNKPEPKPGILKRGDLFAIAAGMVIGSGMVTLIGPAMAYTGYSVQWNHGRCNGAYICSCHSLPQGLSALLF